MIVNLVSDINTESVLKVFSAYSPLSIVQFYEGSFFNNVTESNYSGLKLRKTIDSLLNVGYLEALNRTSSTEWKITPIGLNHLAFLEREDVKEIATASNERANVRSSEKSEYVSIIKRDVRFIIDFFSTMMSPGIDRNQKAQQ